jgi:hypothetical protein
LRAKVTFAQPIENQLMFTKPARKIGPNSRSITGKLPTKKSLGSQHFESSLERDYLSLLECDNDVHKFTTQPVQIVYYINGRKRRYTPDVAVYFKPHLFRKPLLVEIKYQADLIIHKAELEPKFTAAREYCGACGYEFAVITENEIRTDRLYNVKFLSRYKTRKIDAAISQGITDRFTDQQHITPRQLLSNDSPSVDGRMLYTLWQLVADQVLLFDLDKKITMNTIIWKKQ